MVLAMLLLFVTPLNSDAQAPAEKPVPVITVAADGVTQELILKDGTKAIGRVESVADGHVRFRTSSGAFLDVEIGQVTSVSTFAGRVVNGEAWPEDSNPTRLFFAPTGRSLKQGEAYFGVYEIILPFVQVGITDRISIGGGTPPFFFGEGSHPFWVTPKVQVVKSRAVEASVGLLHFANMGDYRMGIAYGVATRGSLDSAVTIGGGWAYARGDSDGDKGDAPLLMIGGEHRVTRRTKLITENYFFEDGGIVSFGWRFMGEHLSVDVGGFTPLGAGEFVIAPMVNIVRKF